MKDLKVLFIEDVSQPLCYTIYELKKQKNGYYTLNCAPEIVRKNLNENIKNEPKKYCYIITLENKIIEVIYRDKVHVLNQVVENLFEFKQPETKKQKSKTLSKKINYKHPKNF